ncbi:hypothetical protein F511_32061 [Dorcoceras hygrometricum]|uniref:Uncharacterized protein n=1 Tax=Dorcoceras hygrometricum TaxID=472368 RepID=A0A2Z7AWD0_9LAMI|nr:hypothetical protein F511_32061 [Dorcoceras hygrometricum]
MTSAHIMDIAVSSKDDVITISIEIISTVDESVDSRYSRRLLMSNVEQEADNSKSNSEVSDVVLKNQQMIQQMVLATMIQQKRKVKDSAVGLMISKDDVITSIGRNCEQQP